MPGYIRVSLPPDGDENQAVPIQTGSTAADFFSGDAAGLRMAVVDDDTVIRSALPVLLPSVRFAGLYRDSAELLADHPRADVVVVDLNLNGRNGSQGIQALSTLVSAGYDVCFHTNERRPPALVCALAVGVRAIVHKDGPLSALADAASRTARGEIVLTQALVALAEFAQGRDAMPSLTDPERRVLSARARGESWHSMGNRMSISAVAAEEHWAIVAATFAGVLRLHSAAELEPMLGLVPGELVNWMPPDSHPARQVPR